MADKATKSVIWAVDPFETTEKPAPAAVRELMDWIDRARLRLIPVHVVSSSEKRLEAGALPVMADVESALRRYLHPFPQRNGWQLPTVLLDESSSRAGIVKSLLGFAKSESAEWVVVTSHGHSGMERLVLGSFAETLLRDSSWPVYFLPQLASASPAKGQRCVLFPTDFSPMSKEAYRRFLPVASAQRLELVLFHLLTFPVLPLDVGMMGMAPAVPQNFLAEQEEWAQKAGEEWVREAARAGIRARFILKSSDAPVMSGKVVLDIAADEKVRMIAMPSVSGAFMRLMAGSVAHEVFRARQYPVWLYGPASLRERRRKAA